MKVKTPRVSVESLNEQLMVSSLMEKPHSQSMDGKRSVWRRRVRQVLKTSFEVGERQSVENDKVIYANMVWYDLR